MLCIKIKKLSASFECITLKDIQILEKVCKNLTELRLISYIAPENSILNNRVDSIIYGEALAELFSKYKILQFINLKNVLLEGNYFLTLKCSIIIYIKTFYVHSLLYISNVPQILANLTPEFKHLQEFYLYGEEYMRTLR